MGSRDQAISEVARNIRSCLICSQDGVPVNQLNSEYSMFFNENIPYSRLGFRNLEELLRSVPDISLQSRGGVVYIRAQANEASSGLLKLVGGQKKATRKRKKPLSKGLQLSRALFRARFSSQQHHHPTRQPTRVPWNMNVSTSSKTGGGGRSVKLVRDENRNHIPSSTAVSGGRGGTGDLKKQEEWQQTTCHPQTGSHGSSHPTERNQSGESGRSPRDENRNHLPAVSGGGLKAGGASQAKVPSLMALEPTTQPSSANFFERKSSSVTKGPRSPLKHTSSLDSSPPSAPAPISARLQSRLQHSKSYPEPPVGKPSPDNQPYTGSSGSRVEDRLKKVLLSSSANITRTVTFSDYVPQPSYIPEPEEQRALPAPPSLSWRSPAATERPRPPVSLARPPHPTFLTTSRLTGRVRVSVQSRLEKIRGPSEPKVQVVVNSAEGSESGHHQRCLTEYCRSKGWKEPVYLIYKNSYLGRLYRRASSTIQNVGYSTTVKLHIPRQSFRLPDENFQVSTFDRPDFVTPGEAKEHAALTALEKLKEREGLQNAPIVKDTPVIIQRIKELLKDKESGIFAPVIEDEYRGKYKQLLPDYWFDIITLSEEFTVEELKGTSSVCYVVTLRERGRQGFRSYEETSLAIPRLSYPSSNTWDVFVTAGTSVSNVYLRFIGEEYSSRFEAFSEAMSEFYSDRSKRQSAEVVVGEVVAASCEKAWWRALVLGIEGSLARVKFIDYGDEHRLSRSKLCKLDRRFYSLPAQAISVTLEGLDEYSGRRETEDFFMMTIIGRCLVGLVESSEPQVSLTLYDTSREDEEAAINLNEILRDLFGLNYRQLPLLEVDTLYTMKVTHVELDGTVYVQVANEGLTLLQDLLKLYAELDFEALSDYTKVFKHKIYLALHHEDNTFYRVKPINCDPVDSKIQVFLIDYGKYSCVFLEDLVELKENSHLLEEIPEQAIRVRLYDLPSSVFTTGVRDRLESLGRGEGGAAVVGKIREVRPGLPPAVELFKRTQPDNLWASINQTIIVEENITQTADILDRFHISSSRSSSPESVARLPAQQVVAPRVAAPRPQASAPPSVASHQPLTAPLPSTSQLIRSKRTVDLLISNIMAAYPIGSIESQLAQNRPVLPDIDSYFDVFINSTVNPSHFLISPSEYLPSLNQFMDEMNSYYNAHNLPTVLKEGTLCAAKDGKFWYRAYIDKILDDENISVKVLDYGCLKIISASNVKPLLDPFTRLPYLGFSAKIHGIVPMHADWNVEDTITMRNLVNQKVVRARLREVLLSRQALGGMILAIDLYSVGEDGTTCNVAEYFVQRSLAQYE